MWNLNEKELLKLLLQELIPSSEDGEIPSAGLECVLNYLEKKAKEDPNLNKLFSFGISIVHDFVISTKNDVSSVDSKSIIFFLKKIENEEPLFFNEFLKHTYMGYYSQPSIRPYFGVSSNPPHPNGYVVKEEEPSLLEGLVKPVKERGICYREC